LQPYCAKCFVTARKLGLEGIVSKRRDFPYRSGRTKSWLKIKNPMSPAMLRVQDGTWLRWMLRLLKCG